MVSSTLSKRGSDFSASIVILGTLDTKGKEVQYLKKLIEERKQRTLIIDTGIRGLPSFHPDISREEVAKAGGEQLRELVASSRREWMMQVMGNGATKIIKDLYKGGKLDGVIAVGGNQGTWIATTAMKSLPIGVPKVVVSTVASGNMRPYIGYKDITVIFSVADMVGDVNILSRRILANAAGAVLGMVEMSSVKGIKDICAPTGKCVIGITALGTTEPAVKKALELLRGKGYEVITFHASGACGSAMEELIDRGVINGVLDLNPHELIGEIFPEDMYAPVRSGRLEAASRRGIPQVVAPGGLDLFCFGAPDTIPKKYRGRKVHYHNPNHTNVRTSREELKIVGKIMADRLNKTMGPAAVLIPLRGWTNYDKKGGELYDPEADEAFIKSLKEHLKPTIKLMEVDAHMNDPVFAETAVAVLDEMMKTCR